MGKKVAKRSGPIRVAPAATKQYRALAQRVRVAEARVRSERNNLDTFLGALALALSVPEGWEFDERRGEFSAPPEGGI